MSYDVIKLACEKLTEIEKMKLAQFLITTSIQAMEANAPAEQIKGLTVTATEQVINDVRERVLKSKPGKISSLENFVRAMFQFQGGISDQEIESIMNHLKAEKLLKVEGSKVIYL